MHGHKRHAILLSFLTAHMSLRIKASTANSDGGRIWFRSCWERVHPQDCPSSAMMVMLLLLLWRSSFRIFCRFTYLPCVSLRHDLSCMSKDLLTNPCSQGHLGIEPLWFSWAAVLQTCLSQFWDLLSSIMPCACTWAHSHVSLSTSSRHSYHHNTFADHRWRLSIITKSCQDMWHLILLESARRQAHAMQIQKHLMMLCIAMFKRTKSISRDSP